MWTLDFHTTTPRRIVVVSLLVAIGDDDNDDDAGLDGDDDDDDDDDGRGLAGPGRRSDNDALDRTARSVEYKLFTLRSRRPWFRSIHS